MFINDGQIEQSGAEWGLEYPAGPTGISNKQAELDDYQSLLNAANAARTVLVADEHDYDYIENNAE